MAYEPALHNERTNINSSGGGSIQVIIPASPFQVRGGAGAVSVPGVSQPCRSCFLVAGSGNTSAIRVNIGAACTSITGIVIPKASTTTGTTYLPLKVDDINLLYFIGGTENDTVDIIWYN
jgi:hypothetical protein